MCNSGSRMLTVEKNLFKTCSCYWSLLMFPPLATLTSYFEECDEIIAPTLKKNPFNGKSKYVTTTVCVVIHRELHDLEETSIVYCSIL